MSNNLSDVKVEIVLPNYNSEAYVSEAINSVIEQTFKNWKLIVVDGNSNLVTDVTDFWTFTRDTESSDPNWLLIATRSLD